MNAEQAKKLREPFKPEQIGKLPKPTKKDNPKGRCNECGGYHGLPAVHLDYVGHAATTDRLIQVDPSWSWEPMAYGPNGEPLMTNGGMWIKLTIAGVTRPGFGDGASPKEIIGDAIRNAAMRFGVALDLWAKEDLHASGDEPKADHPADTAPLPDTAAVPPASEDEPASSPDDPVSFEQRGQITQLVVKAAKANNSTPAKLTETLVGMYGPFEDLSAVKAVELIGKLERWAANAEKAA